MQKPLRRATSSRAAQTTDARPRNWSPATAVELGADVAPQATSISPVRIHGERQNDLVAGESS